MISSREKMSKASIEYMTGDLEKREQERHEFAVKHGFSCKRAQHYKDCIVIRWRTSLPKHKEPSTAIPRIRRDV